jgi:virulence-associated protein VapD
MFIQGSGLYMIHVYSGFRFIQGSCFIQGSGKDRFHCVKTLNNTL